MIILACFILAAEAYCLLHDVPTDAAPNVRNCLTREELQAAFMAASHQLQWQQQQQQLNTSSASLGGR